MEVGDRLAVNHDTLRQLFLNELGALVISCPQKSKSVSRTPRIHTRT
jgi:hypothetical protein